MCDSRRCMYGDGVPRVSGAVSFVRSGKICQRLDIYSWTNHHKLETQANVHAANASPDSDEERLHTTCRGAQAARVPRRSMRPVLNFQNVRKHDVCTRPAPATHATRTSALVRASAPTSFQQLKHGHDDENYARVRGSRPACRRGVSAGLCSAITERQPSCSDDLPLWR